MTENPYIPNDGDRVKFYGVDGNSFCVRTVVDNKKFVLTAVEDPDDGYRSCLKELHLDTAEECKGKIFFATPIAECIFKHVDSTGQYNYVGYALIDATTGHEWLKAGTDDADDYYPYFVFRYTPADEAPTGQH